MHGSFIRSLRLIYIKSRDIKCDVIHRLAADYIFTSRRSLKKKKHTAATYIILRRNLVDRPVL